MSNACARLMIRTLLFAMLLATLLPIVGTAQDLSAADDGRAAPTEEPGRAGSLASTETPEPLPTTAPPLAASPSPSPSPQPLPSRDWRSQGYVSVVDGQLYDPFCRPLRSVGSNVPNLMFRDGLRANLEWMRQRQMRWLRVIATGHGTLLPHDQIVPGVVEQRLASLLREVEAYNAAHPPYEAIYVLVNLTDYYEPGVPGDKYGFDHAGWCNARVLNAPWYRRGIQRYSFNQECGGGQLTDAPNYEVFYKPWVERLVAAGARSPALLGWQLGNEMKARDFTPDDGIDEAFGWYVDWMADMTDTIRAIDRNHLILTGTQYLAELTDYPYRPMDGDPDRRMIPGYEARFDKILRGCRTYCWNVWTLTNYDFHHYAIDDAMYLRPRSVPVMITEHGFTLGSEDEERRRFDGDRVLALKFGRARAWTDIDGNRRPFDFSTIDLMNAAAIQGIAPWASPAPAASAEPWSDLDWQRGISLAREGDALWQAWHEIAGHLEAENGADGISERCAAFTSI
jgi:hypothetical protein